jgi:hypothetical protein
LRDKELFGSYKWRQDPSGKIAGVYQELYFLASVDADQRFLVLTDEEFYELLARNMREKLSREIQLLYCPLTEELSQLVRKIRSEASNEIDWGKPLVRTKDSR